MGGLKRTDIAQSLLISQHRFLIREGNENLTRVRFDLISASIGSVLVQIDVFRTFSEVDAMGVRTRTASLSGFATSESKNSYQCLASPHGPSAIASTFPSVFVVAGSVRLTKARRAAR